jgi:RNA polymerase sigma-70 factor (ECF subfamily)
MSSSAGARYFPGALGKAIKSDSAAAQISSATSPTADIIEHGKDPSDETLIAEICETNTEALACLFRRHAQVVRAVCYRVLRDSSEADDMVQDVFVWIHQDCKAFDSSKGSARFWILQMAYRRAISRRRYLTTRHFYRRLDLEDAANELTDPETGPTQLDNAIDRKVENVRLQRVIAALSEDQQQTLRLFFIEGYTLDEIAAKLGQSRGNVKHHYFRALERLRKEVFGSKLPGERAV